MRRKVEADRGLLLKRYARRAEKMRRQPGRLPGVGVCEGLKQRVETARVWKTRICPLCAWEGLEDVLYGAHVASVSKDRRGARTVLPLAPAR